MGLLDAVEEMVTSVAGHIHKKMETNSARKRLAKEVEASVKHALDIKKSPFEEEFRNASLQEVLAMLVDGVYYRDHKGCELDHIVKPLIEGEYEVDERMAHFTSELYWMRLVRISEEDEKQAGIKHYVRGPLNPNASAPSLVIAIRGTKVSSCQDLVDDVRMAMLTLYFSRRFNQGVNLVRNIIQEYAEWLQSVNDDVDLERASRIVHRFVVCNVCNMNPIKGPRFRANKAVEYNLCQQCFQKHGDLKDYTKIEKPLGSTLSDSVMGGGIYITGHSLGAALALQIGKALAAEERQRFHVHCFNPPFMTIMQLVQEGFYISKVKETLRKSHVKPLLNAASHVKNLTKLAAAKLMDREEQLAAEVRHFVNLKDWVPVFYINVHDNICNKFRKHYKRKQKVSAGFEISSQALLSQVLGRRALFSSLVPSVDMHISKRERNSHALKNWYREPAIDKVREYRLLPGVFVAGIPIHSIVEAIRNFVNESDVDDEEIE